MVYKNHNHSIPINSAQAFHCDNMNYSEKKEVSLVTYTYNDGHLASELLESVRDWLVKPSEIIVVDDGSSKKFKYSTDFMGIPVIIKRHDNNLGCAITKNHGITSSRCQYILSIDCDIRIPSDWLSINLRHIERPEIGLVGSPIICEAGNDIASRYMNFFHGHTETGFVDFITAGIWILKKNTWDISGGLSGYTNKTHEDHYFCKKVRGLNLFLYSNPERTAKQIRKITRTALVKRQWTWFRANEINKLNKTNSLEAFFFLFLDGMIERINYILKSKDFGIIYIELLYMAYVFINIIKYSKSITGVDFIGDEHSFIAAINTFFFKNEIFRNCLAQDLNALSIEMPGMCNNEQKNVFLNYIEALSALRNSKIMTLMEIDLLKASTLEISSDYSFYEHIIA
ncbi:Glycosyltransferase involved in cell wall bisynthesis [Desulfonatronum zhilinae]|nr:Glycosyltransferase involved in cell wall bisynthesis [Desulfonatronum zhilinae]